MIKAEGGVVWPQAKECQQSLKAGRDKKTDSPLDLPERTKPANILLLAQCSLFADL